MFNQLSVHQSHVTRTSDSSLYDERCINCGATDNSMRALRENDLIVKPCPKPIGKGGISLDEWRRRQKRGVAEPAVRLDLED